MAISNHERVGRALKLLHQGLYPYFEREMKFAHGGQWLGKVENSLPEHYTRSKSPDEILKEDVSSLLIAIWENWNTVFRKTLGQAERTLVSELRSIRNDWAHSTTYSTDNAYRALDSISRLLTAIAAPEVAEIDKQKQEVLRLRFEEQARRETRKTALASTEGQPQTGLKPWREIATPHPDVASGRFQQAEFAADLWQVYLDEGSDEYRDPTEFYRRTYLTEGLKQLLKNALLRLSGQGGDPVIELQTNFGGGKTHAMLALYHLCHALNINDLPGIEPLFQETELKTPPQNVNVAVLVGNKISPGQVHSKPDGTRVRTLWGEIGWQLGGKEGYELMREADETSTNPGDALKTLFNRFSPCLILIDEWVAYGRQLHDKNDLPAGDFDTHFTFAQTLSESAKNAKDTLLVVSIPSSDIEIGGDRGKEALDRLKNAIGRVESPWRPASAEESFEIVRRRLFQTMSDPGLFVQRDTVVKAFADLYKNQAQEFPAECKERDYERGMKDAYPIHPELFDRLYSDWSTLDKFQRTRGVLRLMAKVIHTLWERNDASLVIMPGQIPMDDAQVQSELTRYLDDNWIPIIEKDVDGLNSLPLTLDRQNPNLGRYSACRRVSRAIYMGSAPTLRAANRGLEERRVKLGCVQPGESVATFSDALRRLTDQATYLYIDNIHGNRYWVSTQPNVNRTVQERASQILEEHYPVWEEIVRRLKQDKNRGEFSAIHVAPDSSADVHDDGSLGVRLVILHPQYGHQKKTPDSQAQQWIEATLQTRGSSPRYYKNTLLFLAPDLAKIKILEENTAQYLAWESILQDKDALNLDGFQQKQATTKRNQSTQDVDQLLSNAYEWLIIPGQTDNPQGDIEWEEVRIQGADSAVLRASRRAVDSDYIKIVCAPSILKMQALDDYLWRNKDHLDLKTLWAYLTQYLYLPRLKDQSVLLDCVGQGVASTIWSENFAYAEAFDENEKRYLGLQYGTGISPSISAQSLIVKPEIAQAQIDAERKPDPIIEPEIISSPSNSSDPSTKGTSPQPISPPTPVVKPQPRRFYGNVQLDALRVNRDASAIADEIIQHLTKLKGANVKITLEIEADIPNGAPDDIVRTVMENCHTLKFNQQAFENE
jgi:predicted AAA+ superfamily ATPase